MNPCRCSKRAIFALLLLAAPAAAQQPGLRSTDLHRLRSVEDVALAPDGRLIAYVVSNRERPGRPYSQIWIVNAASGEARRLGSETETGSGPRWSPDGQWLAYFGSAGNRSGIVLRRPDGSGTRLLAEVQGSNHPVPGTGERLSWAPDSRRIAFVSATPGPEPPEAGAAGDPIVITRYLYRTTGADGSSYFSDNRRLHIFTVDVASGAVRQLTDGTHNEHSIDWSPRGDEVLFVSNRESDPDRFFNHDIFAVRVSDGRIRQLTRDESVVYRPRWSPDGSMIAYQGTRRGLTSSETTMEDTRVWVMNADAGAQRELASDLDNRHGAPEWSRDGRSVYFTVQERGSAPLWRGCGPPRTSDLRHQVPIKRQSLRILPRAADFREFGSYEPQSSSWPSRAHVFTSLNSHGFPGVHVTAFGCGPHTCTRRRSLPGYGQLSFLRRFDLAL